MGNFDLPPIIKCSAVKLQVILKIPLVDHADIEMRKLEGIITPDPGNEKCGGDVSGKTGSYFLEP